MALPHLKVRGRPINNFRSEQEADVYTRERREEDRQAELERQVRLQSKLDATARQHEQLISEETYTRSLEGYVALRDEARRKTDLAQRRAHLSHQLRAERSAQLEGLQAKATPRCEALHENLRHPGFFERLYAEEEKKKAPRVPPHLRSQFEAAPEVEREAAQEEASRRAELGRELRLQIERSRAEAEREAREVLEEGQRQLAHLRLLEGEESARSAEEASRRRSAARLERERDRKSRVDVAAEEAAVAAAVAAEAERAEAARDAERKLEHARSTRLALEAREGQARQREEKSLAQKRREKEEEMHARKEREALRERIVMEEDEAKREKRMAFEETKEVWRRQLEEDRERRADERRAEEKEKEEERRAEAAYMKMLEVEKAKMRRSGRDRFGDSSHLTGSRWGSQS